MKKHTTAKRKLTAKEFDEIAETGGNLLPYLDLQKARRLGGTRVGAGRKPSGRVQYVTRLTPENIRMVKGVASSRNVPECVVLEEALAVWRKVYLQKLAAGGEDEARVSVNGKKAAAAALAGKDS